MFKYLSLRLKLTGGFLAIALLVGLSGLYQVHTINQLTTSFARLMDNGVARRNLLVELNQDAVQAEAQSLAYNEAVEGGGSYSAASQEIQKLNDLDKSVTTRFKEYQDLLKRENAGLVPQQVLTGFPLKADNLFTSAMNFVNLSANPKTSSKIQLEDARQQLTTSSTNLRSSIDQLAEAEDVQIARQDLQIDTLAVHLVRTILLHIAIVLVASVCLGVIIASVLTRSLRKLQTGAVRIANGDFSQAVSLKRNDEIGELANSFNAMSERLRSSYQRLDIEIERNRTLLESLGEGVISVDADMDIALINDPAMALLELPDKAKVLGTPVDQAFTLADQTDKPVPVNRTPAVLSIKNSVRVDDTYTFHRKDQSKILLHVSADPVLLRGEIAGSIMTFRDVTKEKEVDRMKTEFISLASHQLRTPLSAIRWFSEMLVSGDAGKLNADQDEFAHNIAESTERMIALVNALLNISRIESGRIMVDPKPTDLGELVNGIVKDLQGKLREREQNLVVSVHQDLPKINVDPRLIGQVYLNLLTNAIKYTPKNGEITVFISRKGDDIISQVTDNGYGIPKEQQGRLFQKFFRATNAVKVETDGTGLGLYLIKAVIESSGGRIWFKSEEGKGSTFWFSIPASGMKPKKGEVTLDA